MASGKFNVARLSESDYNDLWEHFERESKSLITLCDELAGALKHIESVCDNTNESHEGIWRLAYNALSKYREARKEGSK